MEEQRRKCKLFDCHAHLNDKLFNSHDALSELLAEAEASGVTDIVSVTCSSLNIERMLNISSLQAAGVNIHRAIGLHPEYASLQELELVMKAIETHKKELICIGEIGLDFRPHVLKRSPLSEDETKNLQAEVFKTQARRAAELGLPVNVHSCAAGRHALAALAAVGCPAAVLHAFDGRAHYAEAAARAHPRWFFSVPPCVVRSPVMQKLVARVPLENLLLESDSPALAPVQGQTNVPANIKISCEEIARIKNIDVSLVASATHANALRLFGIPAASSSGKEKVIDNTEQQEITRQSKQPNQRKKNTPLHYGQYDELETSHRYFSLINNKIW